MPEKEEMLRTMDDEYQSSGEAIKSQHTPADTVAMHFSVQSFTTLLVVFSHHSVITTAHSPSTNSPAEHKSRAAGSKSFINVSSSPSQVNKNHNSGTPHENFFPFRDFVKSSTIVLLPPQDATSMVLCTLGSEADS